MDGNHLKNGEWNIKTAEAEERKPQLKVEYSRTRAKKDSVPA
jgi:hypothetical protein